jgi:hypothetical protein
MGELCFEGGWERSNDKVIGKTIEIVYRMIGLV